jgi:alginate O-acetyltransferase complex protein AlgI
MEITSFSFVGFVAVVVIVFHLTQSRGYQLSIIAIANLAFIGTYITEPQQIVPLFVFLILGYAVVEFARKRRSAIVAGTGIGMILTTYVYLKKFSFVDFGVSLPFPYLVVGLSYILFRILHLVIDACGGHLPGRIKPLVFFNYTCNFLSFISGPIQLYHGFTQSLEARKDSVSADTVFRAFQRIISGYVKVIFVSGVADYLFSSASKRVLTPDLAPEGWHFVLAYGVSATTYTIYLYYNFSGYMDIVISCGRLLGQDLPENFNKPFLARNFLEFWSRWHMTLSQWFKTYLFNPLMKLLFDWLPQPALAPYLGVTAFFVTFFVMGVWHGTTIVFVIYGLLMGAGASINKLWQVALTNRLGRGGYRALSEHQLYIYACRGLTCAFFTLGVTCLWVNIDQLGWLWSALGAGGWVSALLLTAAGSGLAMFIQDFVSNRVVRWFTWTTALSRPGVFGNVWSAAQILLALVVSTFFHKAPEFVYRAF